MTGKVLGVGVVGCGYWGPNLVRNFVKVAGANVVAVCDHNEARAKRVAQQFMVPSVHTSHSDLIARDDVDIVVIATPSFTHFEIAKEALNSGRHVLVMKPLTTSVEQAEELVELGKKKGLVVAVDHTFIYTGAVRAMRQMVQNGDVGEVFYIDSVRINLGLFQSDVNVVWDLAPHDISIIDYLLNGKSPWEVSTIGSRHADSPTENIAYVTLRYDERMLAHVHVNWLAPAKVRQMIVGGSKKMLIYDDVQASEKLKIYDKGVSIERNNDKDPEYAMLFQYRLGDMHAPQLDMREALSREAEHIVDCVRNEKTPEADGEAGLRVVRILEAAEKSLKNNGTPLSF